jgi:ankyrin repeat protein
MMAAIRGHEDTVRMLLDAGADPSTANEVSSCVSVCVCMRVSHFVLCKPGCAAEIARKVKETKYKAACDANGLELLPIFIESTGGRWGKACADFF